MKGQSGNGNVTGVDGEKGALTNERAVLTAPPLKPSGDVSRHMSLTIAWIATPWKERR